MGADFTPDRDAHSGHCTARTRHGLDAASSLHPVMVKLRPWQLRTALSGRCHQSYIFRQILEPDPSVSPTVGWCCAEPRRCSHVARSWAPAPGEEEEWRCRALRCSSLTVWATVWPLLLASRPTAVHTRYKNVCFQIFKRDEKGGNHRFNRTPP